MLIRDHLHARQPHRRMHQPPDPRKLTTLPLDTLATKSRFLHTRRSAGAFRHLRHDARTSLRNPR
jgi:hypothetical protein